METDARTIESAVGRKIYDLWRHVGGDEYDSKSPEQRGEMTRDQYIDNYIESRFAERQIAKAGRN